MCLAFAAMAFAMAFFQMLQDDPHGCRASDRQKWNQRGSFSGKGQPEGRFPRWGCGQCNRSPASLAMPGAGLRIGSIQSLLKTHKFLTLNLTLAP